MFRLKLILPYGKLGRGLIIKQRGLSRSTSKPSPYDKLPPGVMGDWKDYNVRLVTMSDFEQVALHIRTNFLKYNKLNHDFLDDDPADAEDHDKLVKICIGHKLSFLVAKRDSFEIAGVNLILDNKQPGFGFPDFQPKSNNLKIVLGLIGELEAKTKAKLHENYKTDRMAEIFISSADVRTKGQGITEEMYKRGLILLKAKGFQTVKGAFSSVIAQKVTARLGFQELGRILYRDYRDKYGNKFFSQCVDGTYIAMMVYAF